MAHPYWPFFDLRITTPRLELRLGSDADLVALAALTGDIHDEDRLPFDQPWSKVPSPERERNTMQYHWSLRAGLKQDHWQLPFVVVREGEVIGTQGLMAEDFAVKRSVDTGSWLNRSSQGQGYGKEMRAAVLHFAFITLEAEFANTSAREWNRSSIGVTEGLGYQSNGRKIMSSEGRRDFNVEYLMTKAQWEAHAKHYTEVQVEGHERCLPLLGATAPRVEPHGSDQTLS